MSFPFHRITTPLSTVLPILKIVTKRSIEIYHTTPHYSTHIRTQAGDGYDPRKSKVSDDTMENWKNTPTQADLSTVPGLGPAGIRQLAASDDDDDKITNTYQLFGKFLMLKGGNDDEQVCSPIEHTEKFWYWLKNRGINAHRSAIVTAIGTCYY